MKIFHLKIDAQASMNAIQRFRNAVRSKKPSDQNILWCDSYDSMVRVMSKGRIELIEAIRKHKPDSIYELAQTLKRDVANVHRDVKALAEIGMLSLEESATSERERLRPVMLFDKIVWEWEPTSRKAVGE